MSARTQQSHTVAKTFPKFEISASYEAYAEGKHYAEVEQELKSQFSEGPSASEPDFQITGEAKIDAIIRCVASQTSLFEILYKLLVHCETPRDFSEVESYLASQDEFLYSHVRQTPFALIQMMERTGGVEQTPLDENGARVTDERTEGLSEDEIDELIASYRLQTTPEGMQAARILAPEQRLEAQLRLRPHRRSTYMAVLDFCQTPRKFDEIKRLFDENENLVRDEVARQKLSPDFYVDKLEKAGALVWRGAWVTTEAGKQALAAEGMDSGL